MFAFKIAIIAVFCFFLQVVDGQPNLQDAGTHSCAVSCSDNVVCWGDNSYGQLGSDNNMTTMNYVNINNVIQISAGLYHTCALKNDGTVACWGWNRYGQLGDPINNGTDFPNFTPLDVNIIDVKQISAGGGHTCALKNGNTVACWGNNRYGQLGDPINNGTDFPNFTPVDVNIMDVKQISAGHAHTCALKNNNTVACWGMNATALDENIMDVKQISAGGFYTCALKNDNTVACWGMIALDGNITNVKQVSAGYAHTCALKNDNTVVCWGIKFAFGNEKKFNSSASNFYTNITEKMAITQEGNIVQVTAGFVSTCILYDTKEVYCSGSYDLDNPNRTFSFQKDKSILYYKTVTNAAFLAEKNDENICLNTKDDDFKLSIPAIVGIVFGSVLLLSAIVYFILKGKKPTYKQLTA